MVCRRYQRLFAIARHPPDALAPDELMLSLSALTSLHDISSSTGADESEPSVPVQLIDVDRLLNGCDTIQNRHAVLREMVWSFFRAVFYALPPDIYPPYVRFLNSALAAVSSLDQTPDRILDHYWMKRLLHSLSHADAVAEVWGRCTVAACACQASCRARRH